MSSENHVYTKSNDTPINTEDQNTDDQNIINQTVNNENIIINTEPVKILKKRGRKPSGKILDIKSLEQKQTVSSLDPEKECLILHLPITIKDINKLNKKVDKLENINEDNNVFLDTGNNKIVDKCELTFAESTLTNELQMTETSDQKKKCYNCQYLNERCNALHEKLKEVSNMNNIQDTILHKIHNCTINIVDSETCKWKETTNVYCWWCVHPFTNPPFGLPIKYENSTYYVQGCFCSLNCAKAYNLKENNYRTTEINSLIEDFRRELFGVNQTSPVSLAPPRQSLKIFGGYMTIDEFRKEFYILNKNIIHLSPTVSPVRNIFEEEYHDKLVRMNSSGVRPHLKRNTPAPQVSYNLDKIMTRTEEE